MTDYDGRCRDVGGDCAIAAIYLIQCADYDCVDALIDGAGVVVVVVVDELYDCYCCSYLVACCFDYVVDR